MKKKHPAKKHAVKKHLTKKYFTKTFVKTHIIPISAIGILVGATVITLSVYFGVTSCKSNPIPSDAKAIDSSIDNKYIVPNTTDIWTSNVASTGAHNKLLDLQSYVSDKGINTSNFVIKGEVDFGILVNFDEDIHLYGDSQSLISLGTQDHPLATNDYGIIVGNVSQPISDKDAYSGKMNIDSSVNVSLCSNQSIRGVSFHNVRNANNIDINGIFTINGKGLSDTIVGVNFDGDVDDSTINITGVFMITSLSYANGVYFAYLTYSHIYIDGIFNINSKDSCYGVYFYGTAGSSNINISGVFNVSSSQASACGVLFLYGISGGSINISGVFTVTAQTEQTYGVKFTSAIIGNASIDISGVFTIYNRGTNQDNEEYGVRFDQGPIGSININGIFAFYKSSDAFTSGIDIGQSATYAIWNSFSNPQFFSSKVDTGNLCNKLPTAQYKWNGQQINSSTSSTIADGGLEIKPIVAQGNSDFSINVIQTTLQQPGNDYNQNIFNKAYKNGLNNYITNHSTCPKTVVGWLKNIIGQIPFK